MYTKRLAYNKRTPWIVGGDEENGNAYSTGAIGTDSTEQKMYLAPKRFYWIAFVALHCSRILGDIMEPQGGRNHE